MSEQETSRSPQSSTSEVGGTIEDRAGPPQETPESQCCSDLNSCVSSDSGMGNTLFSSPEKCDETNDSSDDVKEAECCNHIKLMNNRDVLNIQCNKDVIKDVLWQTVAVVRDSEVSLDTESNITPLIEVKEAVDIPQKCEEDSSRVREPIQNEEETCTSNKRSETRNDSIETAKRLDTIVVNEAVRNEVKNETEKDSFLDSEKICDKDFVNEISVNNPVKSKEYNETKTIFVENGCETEKDGDKYCGVRNDSEIELISSEKHEEWELEIKKKYEETESVLEKKKEISKHSIVNENDSVEKIPLGCQNNQSVSKDTVDGIGSGLGIDLDAIRDTDSEAGESCYSEDQEHGDACQGENGCIHQSGVCDSEQNWDYVIDEEFNVPRRPVFNGSADQLERRSSLKRKASEEHEDDAKLMRRVRTKKYCRVLQEDINKLQEWAGEWLLEFNPNKCIEAMKMEATPPKCKRGIQFEGVTVFYFPRSQGFTCVPSQGGSSLGMSRRHSHIRQFSLAEHAVEQRRAHREYLMRLRQQRTARERRDSSSRGSSSEDSEENSEEASDLSDSELDADSYYFLQPLPIRQRRALLRQAGICHIEGLEKEECKDIRMSREMCGCQCKVYCDPDTCQCAEAGIKCQVDRHNFPCGCSREGCGNAYGRIEFNPIRVRTHFIHTLMRLEIEKRQHHQQQHQQQQQWQHQQRVKWLTSSSPPPNGFSSSGSSLASGTLPFFEGGRETSGLAVTDIHKFNSSVEMNPCVGSMNAQLYPHFESRQMIGPGAPPSVYIQHDSVSDYNSGTCSVFGGLGTTFDPSAPYGSCHSFPPSSVAPPQVVPPQVPSQVPPPQPTPEAYNSLSKFTNSTNLVSTSFSYSGAVAPAPVPTPVNCSYTQNNFCMPGVHDNTATVFGQYHEPSASTQNLFKADVTECSDFQPNFEAISSSSASPDKTSRYIPASSLVGPSKEICNEYSGATSSGCSSMVGGSYKVDSSASNVSQSPVDNSLSDQPLPTQSINTPSPPLNFNANHLGSSNKDSIMNNSNENPSEATENLGEIVKKSMVETVSA
nr:uncharacterized protein LOC123766738 isoform X1 [Procambarus clarkii]XP_045612011.1 uncharacterized protein LOC123766738 isoform X1 [Procambarus clarkii]XP_045612012.1 uncharacterized protein LOC123766738 isoform X1 [Procambarus clarkii]XP_045612013.1 uncharacterized protein LOC123766738 isoform X1 [Procambarus clarkii]XP_045612014.1 uncharacterized protein LOC123766738 isoform X1 [Procambarus clarkii]XP_045612015.1 uncharacterized protein LOC123766738 isoform X1 [Procambarus clarkii]